MELTDEQRAWLGKAIQQKGRFTTQKAVKSQLKDYISRRGKTALGFAALPADHPQYKTVQDGLKAADKFADAGDLKSAYTTLNNIKAIAKGAASGRANLIQVDAIRRETEALSQDAGVAMVTKNTAIGTFDDFLDNVQRQPKASDLSTFEEAVAFRRDFIAEETRFRGQLQTSVVQCQAAKDSIKALGITDRLETVLRDISALKSDGRGKEVESYDTKCLQIQAVFKSDPHLRFLHGIATHPTKKPEIFEAAIMACKSLAKWQDRDTDTSASDAKTDAIRSDLKPVGERELTPIDEKAGKEFLETQKFILSEEARLERARKEIKLEGAIDALVFMDTSKGDITITPQPAKFDAGDTLDGLAGDIVLGDVVSEEQADAIAAEAAKRMGDFLKDVATDKDKLFDLSIKKRGDLLKMIALDTLGVTDPELWTPSQKAMLEKAATEAEKAICQNLPNQLSSDGAKISVGGKEYKNPVVLKQGGNGKTTLYTDDEGNPIVLKTLLSDSETKRDNMIWEMEIHYRAMQGAEDDSAIVGFHGAVRSENGQMHMVLEAVDGGDLEDRNKALSAAVSGGLIPDEARQAIALGDLLKTVKALKELEKQGLVHRDIKGENVMMTKDGKIKIIDFGESDFLDDTGVIAEGKSKGSTAGYEAEEVVHSKEHDTKADTHAISGLLQRLVADMMPKVDFNKTKMDSGALGRLVGALSDPDPKKRPSLDAILQSTLAKSYEEDFNPENVKDLQDASLEFTLQMGSVKGAIDIGDLKTKVTKDIGDELKDPMKVKDLQSLVTFLDAKIFKLIEECKKDEKLFLSGGREKLAALQNDVAVLKGQAIQPMIDATVIAGETKYKDALKDPSIVVEIEIGAGKRKMTLGKAVEAREMLNTRMMESRGRVMEALNSKDETAQLQVKIDTYNTEITRVFEVIKAIDATIVEAVGPEAKFFLSKVKMEKAASAFGSVGAPETEEKAEASKFIQGVERMEKEDIHDEIKEKATT